MSVILFILMCFLVSTAGAGAVVVPLSDHESVEFTELRNTVETFFKTWRESDTETAVKPLFQMFPVSEATKIHLIGNMTNVKLRLGDHDASEYLGLRALGTGKRYVVLLFVSYHKLLPVAWEFTFYRPRRSGPWQLNLIRFESDDIFEFVFSLPREYERLRDGKTAP